MTPVGIFRKEKRMKIELKPDDIMQVGDIVEYPSGGKMLIDGYAGDTASTLMNHHPCRVFRKVGGSYKKRCKKATRVLQQYDGPVNTVVYDAIRILRGEEL